MQQLKEFEVIAKERGISLRLIQKWGRQGMKKVRLFKLNTTDEWLDEWIEHLAEKKEDFAVVEKQKPIKFKPMRVVGENRVY